MAESLGMRAHAERYGTDAVDPRNGFLVGKRWLDITVAAWRDDVAAGLLLASEIEGDLGAEVAARIGKVGAGRGG